MNNLVDPIKVVFCGGYGVGKTCLLQRLAGLATNETYLRTSGANVTIFNVPIGSTTIKLSVVDISAELGMAPFNAAPLANLLQDAHAACIVLDCGSTQSLREADQWMDMLSHVPSISIKYMIANKADLLPGGGVVTGGQLDKFTHMAQLTDWAFTVGHPALGDVDCRRGCVGRQRTVQQIVGFIVQQVLHNRQSSYYKLMHLPISLQLVSWDKFPSQHVDQHFC